MKTETCRFAPSTTGPAHPGTLLAALLAWLDARSRDARFILRFEDLDPQRCTPAFAEDMLAALSWLGIDWDLLEYQHKQVQRYEAAMDQLASLGRLYQCTCSRAEIKLSAQRAPDNSWVYPGTCRQHVLKADTWRHCAENIRLCLDDVFIDIQDEAAYVLSQNPMQSMGDPIVRRRDGAYAYQLVVVVDDAAQGVTRVVRGSDLIHSTATQCALQDLLQYPRPQYRHHLLLLEQEQQKLAKLHGSVSWREIAEHSSAVEFIAFLAQGLGLKIDVGFKAGHVKAAQMLLAPFDWQRVATRNRLLLWREQKLHWDA